MENYMNYLELIRKKRDGYALDGHEIKYLINGVTNEDIPDYQLSAFLMAVYFNGMTDEETAMLTAAMTDSGSVLDLSCFKNLSCDKHSTGGVGDKTTLIIAPTVAALGGKVAKMSGRALGHTGGTVDKLECIPGYKSELSPCAFKEQVEKTGVAVISQSANLAPADKVMYALRDVTATVESLPLIASSIMSKKLASGAHNIVLDVKFGSGAFMNDISSAKSLATSMVDIGQRLKRKICAVITNMDKPLGMAVGNVLEVKEAIEVLRGKGPEDLRKVSVTLAGLLVSMSRGISQKEGIKLAENALASGDSYRKFVEWIEAQGGDINYIQNPELFGKAHVKLEVKATQSAYIYAMNTESIGFASSKLGAGRVNKYSKIDPLAGIVLKHKTGDYVNKGDTIAVLHSQTPELASEAVEIFNSAIKYNQLPPEALPIIQEIINPIND